ncbi:MAG: zinc ribbon domain-containing protein [Lachnospiraceae bacterium]|nr:zinc ribbon domain-containing protein [Lachnospiraceae bacterium]
MFCAKCGNELDKDALFCPRCGNKVNLDTGAVVTGNGEGLKSVMKDEEDKKLIHDLNSVEQVYEKTHDDNSQDTQRNDSDKSSTINSASDQQDNPVKHKGIFNKIWNNESFTNFAIKYDQILDWGRIPLGILVSIKLFREGGFWGVLFGIGFVCYALASVINIIQRFKKRKDYFSKNRICPECGAESSSGGFCSNCGSKMPQLSARELEDQAELTPENIKAKKKRLLWTPVVVFIAVILLMSGVFGLGTDPHVLAVKNGSPSSYPDKTYGKAFDNFFKSPKWRYFRGTQEGTDEDGDGKPDTEEQNVDVVEFTGYCRYSDIEVKALLQFTLNDDDTFSATFLSFNDVPQNMFTMAALLSAVFEDDTSDSGSTDKDLPDNNLKADEELTASESGEDAIVFEQNDVDIAVNDKLSGEDVGSSSTKSSKKDTNEELTARVCGTYIGKAEDGAPIYAKIREIPGIGYYTLTLYRMDPNDERTISYSERGLRLSGIMDRCLASNGNGAIFNLKFSGNSGFDIVDSSSGNLLGHYRRGDIGFDIDELEASISRSDDNAEVYNNNDSIDDYTEYLDWCGDYDGGWLDTYLGFGLYTDGTQNPECGYIELFFRGNEFRGNLYYQGGNEFYSEIEYGSGIEGNYLYLRYSDGKYLIDIYTVEGDYDCTYTMLMPYDR